MYVHTVYIPAVRLRSYTLLLDERNDDGDE